MADDFLGKQMEDYRSGRLRSAAPRRLSPSGQKPGQLTVPFPSRTVVVSDGLSPQGSQAVRALRNAGCRVLFCGADARQGSLLAQSSGAQYRPEDPAAVLALTPEADVLIAWGPVELPRAVKTVIAVNTEPFAPASHSITAAEGRDISPILTFLCSPAAESDTFNIKYET